MNVFSKLCTALVFTLVLTGCSKIYGVVTANGDGSYQGIATAGNKPSAIKVADNDAKVWCKRKHGSKNYVVVSQDVKQNEAPDVDLGNKVGNALVQVARYADSISRDDDFEATTQFKCSG